MYATCLFYIGWYRRKTSSRVERISGDPGDIVSSIADHGIEHVYIDSADTIQLFLRAGLIQRLIITRAPVLIGSGIPLFGELASDISLRHIETHQFGSGLIQSEYEVAGQDHAGTNVV